VFAPRLLGSSLLLLSVLPVFAERAAVNQPVVNMYSKATIDADVVSQAIYGTNIEVLETSNGWCYIQTPDKYKGWVQAIMLAPAAKPYASSGPVADVVSLFAHIYSERSVTRRAPVITVPFETRLELGPATDERWLEVRLPDKRVAYVQRGDVSTDSKPLSIDAVLELSKRFLGLPYTWGGTSSYGYDCSGYTQMLVRRRGIIMPRDAHLQAAWDGVTSVEKNALQPGDLLFFGSDKKITHTGMYLGGGEFIHATTHQRPVVQVSRLADDHWTKLFVGARRLK
jgi:cell wall-associated NlpC family hydrolase